MRPILLLILNIFLLTGIAYPGITPQKDNTRNPFFTLKEQKQGFEKEKEKESYQPLSLEGVFIWPTKRIALINGQIIKEGEIIEGKKVVSISEEQVVLDNQSGMNIILKLPFPVKQAEEGENR
jgi:hypothetical protein